MQSGMSEEMQEHLMEMSYQTMLRALLKEDMQREGKQFHKDFTDLARLYSAAGYALRLLQSEAAPDSMWDEIKPIRGAEHLEFDAFG